MKTTLKKENPLVFHDIFIMLNQNHTYNLKAAGYHFFDTHFEKYSVKFKASEAWNKLQSTQNLDLLTSEPPEFTKKNIVPDIFTYLDNYSSNTQSYLHYLSYIAIFYALSCPQHRLCCYIQFQSLVMIELHYILLNNTLTVVIYITNYYYCYYQLSYFHF